MCLSIMMVKYIKQHLSNIWCSIQEKVKQHWGWAQKKRVTNRIGIVSSVSSLAFLFNFGAIAKYKIMSDGKSILRRSLETEWEVNGLKYHCQFLKQY